MEQNTPGQPADDLRATCAALQQQVTILLVALLIVSCTLMVYFWRQSQVISKELAAARGPASQVLGAFQQDKPRFEQFLLKIADYGQTHPDFKPIIDKYKIARVAPPGGTPAPAAPAK